MSKEIKVGTVCALSSALVFGLTPILSSITFSMDSNALTLTFYRNALAILPLFIMLRIRKVKLSISLADFLTLGGVSGAFSVTTTYLLYASYSYIGVGLATTLHFLYPVFTVLFGWLFFKQKLDKPKIAALVLATFGVALATGEGGSLAFWGIVLAVLSAVTYACYMLGMEHTAISKMDSMKAMFYMCIANTFVIGAVDLALKEVVYCLQPLSMVYTLIVALANSAFAYVLLLHGVKLIGAGSAAIFSMLEPVSGVAGGVLFLREKLPILKLISCVIILAAVMIPILEDRKGEKMENLKINH